MNRFCIITNRGKDKDLAITNKVVDYLRKNGKFVHITEESGGDDGIGFTDADTLPEGMECAVVIGGDGTILQASHDLAGLDIPLMGINMGTVGFLAETEIANLVYAFDDLFANRFTVEKHIMLNGTIYKMQDDGTYKKLRPRIALNDAACTRAGFSRIVSFTVFVNGEFMNNYKGDGVIIATPTGSTGYSLSAGGPICAPNAEGLLITPVCPHSFLARSIVIPASSKITIKVDMSRKTQQKEASVTMDGDMISEMGAGDYIEIERSEVTTGIIKFKSTGFFQLLRTKLGD